MVLLCSAIKHSFLKSCSGEVSFIFTRLHQRALVSVLIYYIMGKVSCPWCQQLSVAPRDTTPQCVHFVFLSHLFVSVHLVWILSFVTYSKNVILLTVSHCLIHMWSLTKAMTCWFFGANERIMHTVELILKKELQYFFKGGWKKWIQWTGNGSLPQLVTGMMLGVLDSIVIPWVK